MRFNLSFPNDKPFDVVGMGLNSVDFLCVVPKFPAPNSKMEMLRFTKQGGGQVATAMVALSRWGVKTKYIGKVGEDELGTFSLNSIRQEEVDVSSVTIEPNATNQFAMILVDGPSGERTILWDRDERLMYREANFGKRRSAPGRFSIWTDTISGLPFSVLDGRKKKESLPSSTSIKWNLSLPS